MKKKRHKIELKDVLEVVNQRFNMLGVQFDRNDKQFAFLSSRFDLMRNDLEDIRDRQDQHESGLDEIADMLQERLPLPQAN